MGSVNSFLGAFYWFCSRLIAWLSRNLVSKISINQSLGRMISPSKYQNPLTPFKNNLFPFEILINQIKLKITFCISANFVIMASCLHTKMPSNKKRLTPCIYFGTICDREKVVKVDLAKFEECLSVHGIWVYRWWMWMCMQWKSGKGKYVVWSSVTHPNCDGPEVARRAISLMTPACFRRMKVVTVSARWRDSRVSRTCLFVSFFSLTAKCYLIFVGFIEDV